LNCDDFALLILNFAVAAFAPAANNARPMALKMSYESELGAQAPVGFFDPLGEY
jgi:hypothetical protein